MKISVISLFPEMLDPFFSRSIVKRAQEKGAVNIELIQLRDFATDARGTVDDRPYGGTAGMILMAEPLVKAIRAVQTEKARVILTSARGTLFDQATAQRLSKLEHLVIIAGHYEAVDERVMKYINEEISIGDYILTGGELPAAIITDAVARLQPGVLKKDQAIADESFSEVSVEELKNAIGHDLILEALIKNGVSYVRLLEYPQFTRPHMFEGESVPDVLVSGNHAEIRTWQLQQSFTLTKKRRPDLLS